VSYRDSGRCREVIWKVLKEKWGAQSAFVRWHQPDRSLLRLALACFPAAHLRAWFEWDNQLRLLEYRVSYAMAVEVCYVKWAATAARQGVNR
jgi:hypothetical protein